MKNLLFLLLLLGFKINASGQNLTQFVNPFIGTGGHGHTYPGATVPFGMVQLSPDNGTEGWDWSSGYHYSDSLIAGFSHTHLSGTGIGDWSDISVMPHIEQIPDTAKNFRVKFSHDNEQASPGFYSVTLNNGIKASLTTTERVGLHEYNFPAGSHPVIRFNLGFHINWDQPVETYIKKLNDSTIVGYRVSTGWAKNQHVYFAAAFSVPFEGLRLFGDGALSDAAELKGKMISGQLLFSQMGGKTISMKVGLSSVSTEKALIALAEVPDFNFTRVKNSAQAKWEKELGKMTIKTTDSNLKTIFYTALYHTAMAPVIYSDKDGMYKTAKDQIIKSDSQRYTVYSLWDTFRALNPLFTITQPERISDILSSMMAFYDENGLLPVWDLSTWETNTMTGYHAIPVLADAIIKDIPGLNVQKVYTAMKKSAHQSIRAIPEFKQYGYIPYDKQGWSVTRTLEYAFDDWCIAQVAKKIGNEQEYNYFMKRASAYKQLFDKQTGFMRAKDSKGNWITPFDPYFSDHEEKAAYIEGNAWQHSFFVPHDIRGLANLYGSNQRFIQKLDSLFTVSSNITGENKSLDVSGLIGQYAHGNEPSHHIAFMYSYVGAPWKTQERVRQIVKSMYHANPDGYAGNEDCGQMSAWLVWNVAGLYPVNPASSQYVFGSPLIDELTMKLPNEKQMKIKVKNNSESNIYIRKVKLNGKRYSKSFINHTTLLNGGLLKLKMGDKPNKKFGASPVSWPN